MSKTKEETQGLERIIGRKTALAILALLVKLGKASRYDLAKQLGLSYATVMNYITKFKDAGLIEEVGRIEAKRGGKKTIFAPTQKAFDAISDVETPEISGIEGTSLTALPSLGFYSLSALGDELKTGKKGKIQEILKDMRVDVAVVINYRGHPIPIVPISTLGSIDQASSVFNENIGRKIVETAIAVSKRIAEQS